MKIKILAFGIAKDIFGSSFIEVEVAEDLQVAQLKSTMEYIYPKLKEIKSYMIAINDEYAQDDMSIQASDEIAIIPPVSGG